ncbi:insulinase family protein [Salisaeta longa]|uniref:insulinase family protein n=1 Tax=Salisaeta longa TaxID=503170 RepID=UPI00146B63B7|nr:insulinase family protein [Salisaeta longa]
MKRFVLVCLALLLPAVATAQDQPIETVDYDVRDLEFPALRDFQAPEPTRVTLDNGLTVLLLEDHELPTISAAARIATGSVYAPADHAGLASITGTVLRTGGTQTISPDSLNLLLENVGAAVETGIGQTSGSAFMSTLSEHIDTVLPLFASVLIDPAFAEEKVSLAKRQQKSAISRRNDNAQQLAFRVFDKIVYGEDSPYARTPEYYTIDRISRADVIDFYNTYFHPNNVILSVWGDFETEAMVAKLREHFGDWPTKAGFEQPTPPTPTANRKASVSVVPRSDVNQSTVLIGHVGELQRDDADYPATIIMNEVLSGGFSGRLFQNVRKDKGLAYSVFGAYTAGYNRPGRFYAGVFTKSGTTVQAANAVLEEVKGMRTDKPTPEEISLAKDSYLNSFVFNFDTEREVLSRLMTYAYYDYPADFLQQTKNKLDAVTADDVQRVAQKYLYPGQSHILVVGNTADFSQDLSTLAPDGAVDTVDVSIPTEPPTAKADAPASAAAMKAGMTQLQAAQKALGGTAYANLQAMRIKQTQAVQSPAGEQKIEVSLLLNMADGTLRAERVLPNGMTVVAVDNGQTMKAKAPGRGVIEMPASMREQRRKQVWYSIPYLMANLDAQGLKAEALGEQTVEGTTYRAVKVTPPKADPMTLYLDPDTNRPMRITYTGMTRQGPMETTTVIDSYKQFGDVMVPAKLVTFRDGSKAATTETTAFVVNPDIAEGTFTLE